MPIEPTRPESGAGRAGAPTPLHRRGPVRSFFEGRADRRMLLIVGVVAAIVIAALASTA